MTGFDALKLSAASAVGSVIELDATHVGQLMLSRPLVCGPLFGWLMSDVLMGAKLGFVIEFLTIDDFPMGNLIPLNATIATASAVFMSSGPFQLPAAAALPLGLAAGAGFSRIEALLRTKVVRAGTPRGVWRALRRGLTTHAAAAAVYLFVVSALGGLIGKTAWAASDHLQRGLTIAYDLSPWLGLGTLMNAFRPK